MKWPPRNFVIFVGILLFVQFCQTSQLPTSCGDASEQSATPSPTTFTQKSGSSASGSTSASSDSSFSSSGSENENSRSCECSTPSTLLQDSAERSSSGAEDVNSSDIARQLYDRYEAGDEAGQIMLNTVPQAIQRRLDNFSLVFDDLPGLLQRAVLWDSGFVVTAGDQAVQVWTFDNRSMAEISMSVDEFSATGCDALSCTEANGDPFQTYSTCSSSPIQILAASKCVVETFETDYSSNETLWSTGGNSSTVPELLVAKNVGMTECGCEYTVYSIHTTSSDGSASTTRQCERSGSLVVPCHGNDSVPEAMKARITTPKGTDWVSGWILEYRNSATTESSGSSNRGSSSTTTESAEGGSGGFDLWWLLLILLIILLLIVATIVACRHCHRLSRFTTPPDNTTYIFVGGRMWAVEEESHSRGATYWLRFANWCRKTFNFFG